MTQQEFNQQHPTGEQLTMIHYDFETGERTAQPAVVMGTKQNPKYPDDPDEFLVRVRITTKGDTLTMDPVTFGILSNINNLYNHSIMATTNKLAQLEAKLNEAQAAYDQESHHSTGARIAFVAAGNLTRGSYHRLLNHRETLSKLGKRLEKLRLSVKLAKGTPLTLHDVEMARMYLPMREYQEFSDSNPIKTVEMVADFVKGFWRGHIFVDYGRNVAVREKGSSLVYMTSDFERLIKTIS